MGKGNIENKTLQSLMPRGVLSCAMQTGNGFLHTITELPDALARLMLILSLLLSRKSA